MPFNAGMGIAALVCAGASVACHFGRRSSMGVSAQIEDTETSKVAQLREVAEEMGTSYEQIAELKGKARCERPLRAHLSGTPCVWYRFTVEREREERYRDDDGHWRTRTTWNTVAENEEATDFHLSDGSGKLLVLPEGATEIHGIQTHSAYEAQVPSLLESFLNGWDDQHRTLGFRLTEWCIPVEQRLYVLGHACREGGELVLKRSPLQDKAFVIAAKSEEQLLQEKKSSQTLMLVGTYGLAALSLVLLALAFTR